ncbi:MAG: 50S ribosomal protein L22 [Patescibacteria group bacterium]
MPEIIAKTRYAQSTPRKLRAVAVLVKKKPAVSSLVVLQHTPQKAAEVLAKTIKSAIYNAVNNFNFDKTSLIIKNILINEGPSLKRYRANARGSGSGYKRKTAHIIVILEAPLPVKSAPAKVAKVTKSTSQTKKKAVVKPKGTKTTVSVKKRK